MVCRSAAVGLACDGLPSSSFAAASKWSWLTCPRGRPHRMSLSCCTAFRRRCAPYAAAPARLAVALGLGPGARVSSTTMVALPASLYKSAGERGALCPVLGSPHPRPGQDPIRIQRFKRCRHAAGLYTAPALCRCTGAPGAWSSTRTSVSFCTRISTTSWPRRRLGAFSPCRFGRCWRVKMMAVRRCPTEQKARPGKHPIAPLADSPLASDGAACLLSASV